MTLILQCDMCENQINLKKKGIYTNVDSQVKKIGWLIFKGGAHTCLNCNSVERKYQLKIEAHRNEMKKMQGVFSELAIQQEMTEKPISHTIDHSEEIPSIEILPDSNNGIEVYACRYCEANFERTKKGMAKVYVHERDDHPDQYISLPRGGSRKGNKKNPKRPIHYVSLNTKYWKALENR